MDKELNHLPLAGMWAITDEGLINLKNTYNLMLAQDFKAEMPEHDSGIARVGSAGVVSIKGPIMSSSNWMTQILGIATYTDIQQQLLAAVEDPDIDRIVLDINSPGGQAAGADSTAELIAAIDAGVKPVYAATDGIMGSAAYWMGSQAREIYASRTSEVGSIGAALVHMEQSKLLEEVGVSVTVFRSGKYKYLGSPYEALSDTAREEIQDKIDAMNDIFVETVAQGRSKDKHYVEQVMGQGRTFMARNAKQIGMIDHVMSFQAAIADISAKSVDNTRFPYKISS